MTRALPRELLSRVPYDAGTRRFWSTYRVGKTLLVVGQYFDGAVVVRRRFMSEAAAGKWLSANVPPPVPAVVPQGFLESEIPGYVKKPRCQAMVQPKRDLLRFIRLPKRTIVRRFIDAMAA